MPQRFIHPVAFGQRPTEADLEVVCAVLDGPAQVLLPIAQGDKRPTGVDLEIGLGPGEDDESNPTVLAIATSGSTGGRKIVLLPEQALRASAAATELRMGGPGQWLLCLSLTHIAGVQVVLRSHLAGTTPVTCRAGGPNFAVDFATATNSLTAARRYVSLVPTQLRRLLDEAPDAAASFDGILLGGAAADQILLDRADAAGCTILTTYGMSETAGGCVYDGTALAGVSVDTDPVSGQISLTGAVVARGYLGADLFAGHTFVTQDCGEIIGGRLIVRGRLDDIINTGGEKIAPASVEAALHTVEEIGDVAVLGVPDPLWGQRIVALVVSDQVLDLGRLRHQVGSLLPRAAVPRQIFQVAQIPRIGIGKPDRSAVMGLAQRLIESANASEEN